MRVALRLLSGHAGQLVAAAALAAAMVLAGVGLLATSGYLIGRAALRPDTILALMVAVTGVRFFGLTRAAVRYAERLVSHDLTLRVLATLRRRVYARLVPLAPLELDGHRSADLLGRLVADVDELQSIYLRGAVPLLAAGLVTVASVALVALLSPIAAWATLALLVVAGLAQPALLGLLGGRLGRHEAALRNQRRVVLLDTLHGAQELWVYGRGADYLARLAALDGKLARLTTGRARLEGLRDGSGALIGMLAPWAAIVTALPQVTAGHLAPLLLLPLALGVSGAFEAMAPLSEAFERWGRTRAAATRIEQVLGSTPRVRDPEHPEPLPKDSTLRLVDVSFGYGRGQALEDIDLEVQPGRRIALVGASGSGKSSLLRLLLRFVDPARGSVTMGGVDLRALRQEEVRSRIAMVPQTVTLFNASVRANLAIARPGATDEALWSALERAELAPVVRALPDGLDSIVGEFGSRLSTGELQRLAIARALLKRAPLLLLDEPTAHLDTLTERRVLRALLEPRPDVSVVLATHRLVALEAIDEILVLERGRVVQRGPHALLATRLGPFRALQGATLDARQRSPDPEVAQADLTD